MKSAIERKERARKAGKVGGKVGGRGREKIGLEAKTPLKPIDEPKERTREAVAKEYGIPENKLRDVARIKREA